MRLNRAREVVSIRRITSLLLGTLMPVTVLLVVPGLLYWKAFAWDTRWSGFPDPLWVLLPGTALILLGSGLILWTTVLFWNARGTPAPWHPPERFVVRGPYRHVRNPMILGVLLILTGEALLAGSLMIGGWAILFLGFYHGMLLAYEEPDLRERFGERYRRYHERVPRWWPRLRPVTAEELEPHGGS